MTPIVVRLIAALSVLFDTVVVGNATHAMLLAMSILAGITYAGMGNIMLGSLGVIAGAIVLAVRSRDRR